MVSRSYLAILYPNRTSLYQRLKTYVSYFDVVYISLLEVSELVVKLIDVIPSRAS